MTLHAHHYWFIAGTIVSLMGVATVVMALLADRARGRKRCPSCFYSMEGIAGLRCPECGRVARAERKLFRTRRRWRMAMVGLLIVTAGGGCVGWPLTRSKNPWALLPHRVLGWVVPYGTWFNTRQQHKLVRAFAPGTLSRAEYEAVIGVYAEALRTEPSSSFVQLLESQIGRRAAAPDGTIQSDPTARHFLWHHHDTKQSTYTLLSDTAAIDLADALVSRWRTDLTFKGEMAGRELGFLAYWHPAVAEWAMKKLNEDHVDWVVYAIDPRSRNGEVFRSLLADFQGRDELRRERAAVVLASSYFEITTHWQQVPADLQWIKDGYPDYDALQPDVAIAGDQLLELARSANGERQRAAILSLAKERVFWRDQCTQLQQISSQLPADLVAFLTGIRPAVK